MEDKDGTLRLIGKVIKKRLGEFRKEAKRDLEDGINEFEDELRAELDDGGAEVTDAPRARVQVDES